ncbi:MAG: hypothetical protein H6619_06460 [Deltaproteobacteria bacterium]|nr:hypothetical protein [Deltaproteobacteria bacterium]
MGARFHRNNNRNRNNQRGRGGRNFRRNNNNNNRGHRSRNPRDASISGNKRERISVESGQLVFIDQFMLANPQFVDAVVGSIDEPEKRDDIVKQFGGCVVSLEPGTYRIERDPFAFTIVIHPDGEDIDTEEITSKTDNSKGRVFIDTRCLAMIDRELLDDEDLLRRYQDLWFNGEEKECRDLLRDNGGAVRYGFQRYGDELGVYHLDSEDVVCLWPDVAEPDLQQNEAS